MKNTWLCLAICMLLAKEATATDDWTQRFPAQSPSERYAHAMAYTASDQILLFGGFDGTYDGETWLYDFRENTWSQQYPGVSPSARDYHSMTYIGGDSVLLFGGSDGSRDDETWLYDLSENTWSQQSPSVKPSGRIGHEMVYVGGDQVLLFGGDDGSNDNETWLYDLSEDTWTEQSPSTRPSERRYHGMAYIGSDRVLLYGGNNGGDETWVYDLSDDDWVQHTPLTGSPGSRREPALAYLGDDKVLLFSGVGGSDSLTWIYDLSESTWTYDANTTEPSYRWSHQLCGTSMDGSNYIVLFGGMDSSNEYNDIWKFGGGDWNPVHLPQVALASPNGGEVLADSTTITWTATDPDSGETDLLSVDLYYSSDAGSSWAIIDTNQTNTGSYFWDLSLVYSNLNCLVRINVTDTTERFNLDISDSIFVIHGLDTPQVTINYPNGGEILADTVTIVWTANDFDSVETALLSVDLDYSDDAGISWLDLASDLSNAGSYLWDISGLSDGFRYLVRITATDTTDLFDTDNCSSVFAIDNVIHDDWTQEFHSNVPSGREKHKMAYAGTDKVLLFGGYDYYGNSLRDTWLYDLSSSRWIQKTLGP
ncbi:Kelch repeat-containing protein [Candidatus Zixiibacteriota bacterium]